MTPLPRRTLPRRSQVLLTAALSLAAAGAALHFAWVSDDCFITFRHLQNVWAGNGPVFNAGERVQGYTHPLWFGVLLLGGLLVPDPVLLSISLGIALTALTVALWVRLLLRADQGSPQAAGVAIATVAVLLSSPSFLAFQTSGLENALSHLLLVLLLREVQARGLERAGHVTLIWALLGVNRLDFAVACLPTVLLLLPTLRTPRKWLGVALGALPMAAWLLIAQLYYGDPLPNTAHAKVGIFPSLAATLEQGGFYLSDWVRHEPLSAGATALSCVGAIWVFGRSRDPLLALPLGALAHGGYVLAIGGDFMRGRFWMATLVMALGAGGLALLQRLRERETAALLRRLKERETAPLRQRAALALTLLCALASQALSRPDEAMLHGIGDERAVYTQLHLRHYLEHGLESTFVDTQTLDALRRYAELCGPFTIHAPSPGTVAYMAGPDVRVIDTLGLSDATIAALGPEHLIQARPRVGHPFKRIPMAYLASRGDLAIIQGWLPAIHAGDCSYLAHPAAYENVAGDWTPPGTLLPLPAWESALSQ